MNDKPLISLLILEDIKVDPNQNFLIIDDDKEILDIIVELLKIIGFTGKTLEAGTINEAKKHLKYEKIDYILSDWNLPDGEGIAFLKAIRKSPKFHDIPFLMITGQSDIDSLILSSKFGSSEFLAKPFEMEDFIHKLVSGWKSHSTANEQTVFDLRQKIISLEEEIIRLGKS